METNGQTRNSHLIRNLRIEIRLCESAAKKAIQFALSGKDLLLILFLLDAVSYSLSCFWARVKKVLNRQIFKKKTHKRTDITPSLPIS